MVGLLIRQFIKDRENVSDPEVRRRYGEVCGGYGIGINLLLFLGKLAAGLFSGSIAITADAFNNLSDAGSSIVTLFGFRLAAQAPDRDHPYGHGRFEYISGMLVSVAILLMGVELLRTGIEKILRPRPVDFSTAVIIILAASILLKLYMAYYNRKYGNLIDSAALRATALDSLSDCAATAAVLVATLLGRFTDLNVDGWAGAMVAVFIAIAGLRSLKETVDPLLGLAPDEKLVREVYEIVNSHSETKGIHDLIVHDYGPGRRMISLHVEVDGNRNVYDLHDAIDAMELELNTRLSCSSIIHMDPIAPEGQPSQTLRSEINRLLQEKLDKRITIHDLRVLAAEGSGLISFDSLVPPELCGDTEALRENICRLVAEAFPGCAVETVIDVEI